MNQFVEINHRIFVITLPSDGKSGIAVIDGTEVPFDFCPGSAGSPASLLIDGRCYSVDTVPDEGEWVVRTNERDLRAMVTDESRERRKSISLGTKQKETASCKIKAPMPGLIIKLEVEKGMFVEKGAGIVIIEAMKMENEIKASQSGIISEISVIKGQTVEKGQNLITISQV